MLISRLAHARSNRSWFISSAMLGLWIVHPVIAQPPLEVLEQEDQRVRIIEKIIPPTIAIFDRTGAGGGSGVIISEDGYALTNFHVTQPCGSFMKCGLSDGQLLDAVIVGIDPTGDVALIKLVGLDRFPTAEWGDSDEVRAGDWCLAAGNPMLLATDFRPTVTMGIVSGVHRYQYPAGTLLEYTDCIQTDVSVNPGNSGGPLFDMQGRLIGINGRCSFEKRGRVNVGVAYAISVNQIKNFLGSLMSGRVVDHATLGATATTDEQGRVVVSNILESSDAYRRGLRIDDQIVSMHGRPIHTVNGLKNLIGIYPRGWRIPVTIQRNGKEKNLWIRLAGVHASEELWQLLEGPQKPVVPPEQREPKDRDAEPKPMKSPVEVESESLPAELKEMYEQRRGFANYYFNRWHVRRVLDKWRASFHADQLNGEWSWMGRTSSGDSCELVLRDEEAFLISNLGQHRADLTKDLDSQLQPERSGGFLTALSLWRRLAILHPAQFGDVTYLGTAPYRGQELLDVIVATYQSVEMWLYFHPEQGTLVALEMYPTAHHDPCEITFEQYESLDGNLVPKRMSVQYAEQAYDSFTWETIRMPGAGKTEHPDGS